MSNFALKQVLHFAEYPDSGLHVVRFQGDWVNALCDADAEAKECNFPELLDPISVSVCRTCMVRLSSELREHQEMLWKMLDAYL